MFRTRVIPSLLLKNKGLVKTVRFKEPKYLGDPLNAVKIFNEKEVDELIFLDIGATLENRRPQFDLISSIAGECFMPFSYGGGIKEIDDIKKILNLGAEKIVINSIAVERPEFIREAADFSGTQSVIVSIDVNKNFLNKYEVFTYGGTRNTKLNPVDFAVKAERMGAGEIFLNSIDRDGTMQGYDIDLIKSITGVVNIPVIACGGAGGIEDFRMAIKIGLASAVAAGSFFVFRGKQRAFLINVPTQKELEDILVE